MCRLTRDFADIESSGLFFRCGLVTGAWFELEFA